MSVSSSQSAGGRVDEPMVAERPDYDFCPPEAALDALLEAQVRLAAERPGRRQGLRRARRDLATGMVGAGTDKEAS